MIPFIRVRRNSLFVKLLLGFTVIVLISFLFNVFSFNFFKSAFRQEIIKYNKLNMSNTVNNYEKQFRLLDDVATALIFHPDAAILEKGRSNVFAMNRLAKEINTILSTYTNLNLENMFYYNGKYDFIIDKSGLTETVDMLESHYMNGSYDLRFWKEQTAGNNHMRIFPAATFRTRSFDGVVSEAGTFFPVVVKSKLQKDVYIGAFIKADDIYQNFHFSVDDMFYMTDDKGTLFYGTPMLGAIPRLPSEGRDLVYDTGGHNYFFFQKGDKSGLTYVNVIPNQQIASEITRLSLILLILLALSVGLGLLLSVWLSYRFKSPVQRMLESLRKMNPNFQLRSTIHEFTQIEDSVKTIIAANHKIQSDLQKQNTLLKKYGYINKVKSIPIGSKEVQHLIDTTKPFYFVMFQPQFTRNLLESLPGQTIRMEYLLEFIDLNMRQNFRQSETLQIEKDLFVAIIFAGEDGDKEENADTLIRMLHAVKQVFDRDSGYFFTIATDLRLRKPSEFTAAYEETRQLICERRLNDETQIITERSTGVTDFRLSPVEAQELSAHVAAGNESDIMTIIRRLLHQLSKSGRVFAYKQMADEIISQLLLALMTQKIEVSRLLADVSPYEQVKELVSEEQYVAFYTELIGKAASLINDKKADKDPIIDYVLAYMNKHYSDEISQESIADKLNISCGYMSKYIKNKTGQTFSEYLEDIRIRNAKSLLEQTDDKIHDIAFKVGYTNANSFTRMFRRITGVTPGEYRRNNRTGS